MPCNQMWDCIVSWNHNQISSLFSTPPPFKGAWLCAVEFYHSWFDWPVANPLSLRNPIPLGFLTVNQPVSARPPVAPNKAHSISVCVSSPDGSLSSRTGVKRARLRHDQSPADPAIQIWSFLKRSFRCFGYYCWTEARSPVQRKVCIIFMIV